MNPLLVAAVERALSDLIREDAVEIAGDPTVVLHFESGDLQSMAAAVRAGRDKLNARQIHDISDAAGVVSHTSGGQPFPLDTRLDMALSEIDIAAAVQAQETPPDPVPGEEPPPADQMPGDPPPDELPPIEGEGA